ncbi:MAG: SUMF1/EgtB/PvdO family nonheme iron enzyme, partial [Candidatus Woesearchaeota archaeon]
GCVGNNYHDYADRVNDCNTDCTCTDNTCASPMVTANDPRCTECQTDNDCNALDKTYCVGDLVKQDDGRCNNFSCTAVTSTLSDCNNLDKDYCDGSLIKHDDGQCANSSCVTNITIISDCDALDNNTCVGTQIKHNDYSCSTTIVQCALVNSTPVGPDCNDGKYCNGQEACLNATCLPGTTVNCSSNNLAGISQCDYNPDGNSRTKDFFAEFISTCDEGNDRCTTGMVVLTHYCDITCGANWDATHICAETECNSNDGCYSGTYRDYINVPKTPSSDCTCSANVCNVYVERVTDVDGDLYDTQCDQDCNDNNQLINPGLSDICDGLDNDCNPLTQDGSGEVAPLNSKQAGVCLDSRKSCISGGWQDDYSTITGYGAEVCDGLDNNCNGSADEGLEFRLYYRDNDHDGYGTLPGVNACQNPDPINYVLIEGDCNDTNVNVNPGKVEICNNVDDNCDGQTDEELFRFVNCGFNLRGLQEQYCNYGSWENGVFPCDDPDECVMNTSELRACSSDVGECKVGNETYSCDLDLVSGNYRWFALGDCESTGVLPKIAGILPKPEATSTCTAADLDGKDNDCNGVVDDGLCMVNVPAGEFKQGCEPTYQTCNSLVSDDVPAHTVNLDSYSIDKYEVSNGQYKQCVVKGVCSEPSDKSSLTKPDYYDNYQNYPVMNVTWQQANDYCNWAGKGLPTEAEWEKAAKGASPSHNTYPWGASPLPSCTFVNYNISCVGDTWPVDNTPGTPQNVSLNGAVNMTGNVSEFVRDYYNPTYYSEAPYQNPTGPVNGTERVTRGGFYSTTTPNKLKLTTYGRVSAIESFKGKGYGLRCKK